MVTMAPIVTTPVPPTPVTSRSYGLSSETVAGNGSLAARAWKSSALTSFFLRLPPSTVTKLGQKPFRQEKSLLQEERLICRLRPNGVSFGSTDRQFDSTE